MKKTILTSIIAYTIFLFNFCGSSEKAESKPDDSKDIKKESIDKQSTDNKKQETVKKGKFNVSVKFKLVFDPVNDKNITLKKEKTKVISFGIGSSSMAKIAERSAITDSAVNMLDQMSGRIFKYSETKNVRIIASKNKGRISGAYPKATITLPGKKTTVIIIEETEMNIEIVEGLDIYEKEISGSGDDIVKVINELRTKIITNIIDENFKDKKNVSGKIYMTNLKVEVNE